MKKHLFFTTITFLIASCGMQRKNNIQFNRITTNEFSKKNEITDLNNHKSNYPYSANALDLATSEVKIENYGNLSINSNQSSIKDEPCDKILLRNGGNISAKVINVSTKLIYYKNCDDLNGSKLEIPKNEVFAIKYADGRTENFKEEPIKTEEKPKSTTNYNSVNNNSTSSTVLPYNNMAILSLVFGTFPLVPVLGIVFGAMGLSQIKREGKTRGKKMAILGIVLTIIWLIAFLIFLI